MQTTNLKKWGVQEGVKMMVTTSLMSNNFGIKSSQKVKMNNKNCSKQPDFSSPGFAGTVAAIAAVSSMSASKTSMSDAHWNEKSAFVNDKRKLNEKSKDHENSISTYSISIPICTPISTDSTSESSVTQQCDKIFSGDSNYNQSYQVQLTTPSIERLLPIGVSKSPGKYYHI